VPLADVPDTLEQNTPHTNSITFTLSDSSGEERYSALQRLYYRGAHVAWIVFDMTQPMSLTRAENWIKELRRHEDTRFIFLVANKSDLEYMSDESTMEQAKQIALDNACFFMETSAKNNHNITSLFEKTAHLLFNEYSPQILASHFNDDSFSDDDSAPNTIQLDDFNPSLLAIKSSSKCCSLSSVQER